MNRIGKWKLQLLLCILGLGGLTVIAGSSAAAPVDPDPERQVLVAEQYGVSDLKPSSNAVTSAAAPVDPDPERQVPVAELYEAPDLQPSSSAVTAAAVEPDPERQVPVAGMYETPDLQPSSSAGTPPPVDPGTERQVLAAKLLDASDLQTSSSAVVPATQAPTVQQETAPAAATEDEPEPKTTVNQQSDTATKGSGGDTEQTKYTWQDGDRTLTVVLQSDLVINEDASTKDAMADAPGGAIVKSAGAKSEGKGLPVFKSQSGALMTLPGGILLVLDPDWSQAEVNAFFSSNSIKLNRVEALDYIDNGYFIETEPGFPSLDLANSVATQEGVMVSSPNWWTEVTVK